MASICAAIRNCSLDQIPGCAIDLNKLVCDGKTLLSSSKATAGGGSALKWNLIILGDTGHGNRPGLLYDQPGQRARRAQETPRRAGSWECADPGGCAAQQQYGFGQLTEEQAELLPTVKSNQKALWGHMAAGSTASTSFLYL